MSQKEQMFSLKWYLSGAIAILAVHGLAAAAEPAVQTPVLKRRTISLITGGQASEITLPIGTPGTVTWSARKTTENPDGSLHLSGHVQLVLTLAQLPPMSMFSDEAIVHSEELDAGQATAVRDLQRMGITDQSLRGNPSAMAPADVVKQEQIDQANMRRLAEIVKAYGWPGNRFAGIDNAGNAFLVLQHADLASQRAYLPLLRRAVAHGEANAQELAMLEDRVLMRSGQPQLYGTQFQPVVPDQPLTLYPVQDEAHLEQRRSDLGMPPMADYIKAMQSVYGKK